MGRDATAGGKRFERTIATGLRVWLGEGWTVVRNQTDRQKGQVGGKWGEFTIEHPTDRYPFCVECKNRATFDPVHLWRPTAQLRSWWDQAVRQAKGAELEPLLIVRKATKGWSPTFAITWSDRLFRAGFAPGIPTHTLSFDERKERTVGVIQWDHFRQVRWSDYL